MVELIAQWIIFISCTLIFFAGAVWNGLIAWRIWYKNVPEGPSTTPLLFGVIGIVAVLSVPVDTLAVRMTSICIPIILDYGTGAYLLLVLYSAVPNSG